MSREGRTFIARGIQGSLLGGGAQQRVFILANDMGRKGMRNQALSI